MHSILVQLHASFALSPISTDICRPDQSTCTSPHTHLCRTQWRGHVCCRCKEILDLIKKSTSLTPTCVTHNGGATHVACVGDAASKHTQCCTRATVLTYCRAVGALLLGQQELVVVLGGGTHVHASTCTSSSKAPWQQRSCFLSGNFWGPAGGPAGACFSLGRRHLRTRLHLQHRQW